MANVNLGQDLQAAGKRLVEVKRLLRQLHAEEEELTKLIEDAKKALQVIDEDLEELKPPPVATPLKEITSDPHVLRALSEGGIKSVEELVGHTKQQLHTLMGPDPVKVLEKALHERGLSLRANGNGH